MNCCDEYGKCTQGDNCPARCCNGNCNQGRSCPTRKPVDMTLLVFEVTVAVIVAAIVAVLLY